MLADRAGASSPADSAASSGTSVTAMPRDSATMSRSAGYFSFRWRPVVLHPARADAQLSASAGNSSIFDRVMTVLPMVCVKGTLSKLHAFMMQGPKNNHLHLAYTRIVG